MLIWPGIRTARHERNRGILAEEKRSRAPRSSMVDLENPDLEENLVAAEPSRHRFEAWVDRRIGYFALAHSMNGELEPMRMPSYLKKKLKDGTTKGFKSMCLM